MTVKLRGLTWQNPRGYQPLVAVSAAWEARTGVRVEWDQLPWYAFERGVLESLAAGGPYDLVMFDHPWTGTLAARGWLRAWDRLLGAAALDDLRRRAVTPSLESYELEGHLWALPVDAACQCAVFRGDMVDEASLPGTWRELELWAGEHHDPPRRYGLVLCLEGVQGTCLFLSMMASLGHEAFAGDGAEIEREVAASALISVRNVLRFVPPGSTRWGPWDVYDRFVRHDDVTYCPALFGYVNYFGRTRPLRAGLMPRLDPRSASRPLLGGVGLGLSAGCPYPAAAAEYGAFLMDDATQREIVATHRGQPGVRAAWEDPSLDHRSGGFYGALARNMAAAYVRPRHEGFHEVELRAGAILQSYWEGEVALAETLDALQSIATRNNGGGIA